MLSKRIIPCLDVRNGRLTKGIKFQGNIDIGDPVEAARAYYEQGADEIVFYDITASAEDMRSVILAGAEKVSVNSAAVQNPALIAEGAQAFGSQCVVLGMDVKKVALSEKTPSGYEMVIHGGRTATGIDAIWWACEAESLGAGEICLNSIDADGTQDGYEIDLVDVLTRGKADAALIASMVHYRTCTIAEIKDTLEKRGVKVRRYW
jgi:cyclase